jgi:hypothetical protein
MSDDDEPITPDWLRTIGFTQSKPSHVWNTPNVNWWNEQNQLEIWEFNDSGEFLWIECDSVPMTKRKHLRLLIEWFALKGIK